MSRAEGFQPFPLQPGQEDKGRKGSWAITIGLAAAPAETLQVSPLLWIKQGCLRPLPSSLLPDLKTAGSAVKPGLDRSSSRVGAGALLFPLVPKKRHCQFLTKVLAPLHPTCCAWDWEPSSLPYAIRVRLPFLPGCLPFSLQRTGQGPPRKQADTSQQHSGTNPSALTLAPISPGGPTGPGGP